MTAPDLAIDTTALHRHFGDVRAVDGLDLAVARGTCFGLLGHNGAGKSTAIRVLTGRARPTSGSARVLGADVVHERSAFRARINLVAERQNLHPRLSARQTMHFWADLYDAPRERGDDLLRRVALDPERRTPVRDYSTGMRQRLVIARSLVNEPELLFLDEPTRGLDPASARRLRGIVRELIEAGTTVCLTTHDMAEAEELCDTIAIMDHGRIIAQGSPDELRSTYAGSGRPGARVRLDDGSTIELDLAASSGRERLADLATADRIASVHTTEPSLTDVFVGLVGQPPEASTEVEP